MSARCRLGKWWTLAVVAFATLLACSGQRTAPEPTASTREAVNCASNADCNDGKVCTSGKCTNCDPTQDLCSAGQYCASTQCVPGCKANSDCVGQDDVCQLTTHVCVECLADTDCGAGQRCAGMKCVQGCAASSPCAAGQTCCGGACVDLTNNMDDCGACGVGCPTHPNGIPACVSGGCTYACVAGFADCDGDTTDGCEIDTRSDIRHCGSCSNPCAVPSNATATCARSTCGYTCAAGYTDCDGLASNGCEIHTAVDSANCGGCGIQCVAGPSQTAACVNGACDKACVPGFADCDGNPANGCETDITTTANCGACNNACTAASGFVATCSQGQCLACDSIHRDCDHNPSNGCETYIQSPTNCGACGNACPVYAHEKASCTSGICSTACIVDYPNDDVWGNCDGNPANGCETPLDTSQNCGGCGAVCQLTNAYASYCHVFTSATCSPACDGGYADCDGNPANGCELLYNLYQDLDGDGYGHGTTDPSTYKYQTCTPPGNGFVANDNDCDDANADVHPNQQAFFSTPLSTNEHLPVFDYNCDGSVEGAWGSNACANGNVPGAWYDCDANVPYGQCTWNGSSCTFNAGWVWVDGKGPPSCEYEPTYISDCFQSGTSCNAVYTASSGWGCH